MCWLILYQLDGRGTFSCKTVPTRLPVGFFSWLMVTVGSATSSLRLYKKTSWAGHGKPTSKQCLPWLLLQFLLWFPFMLTVSLRLINPFLIHVAFGHGVYYSSRNLKTVDKPNSSCGRKEDSWDRKVKRCLALSRAGSSCGWDQDLLSLPLNLSYFLSFCEVQPLWVGTSFYNPCPHFSWVVS